MAASDLHELLLELLDLSALVLVLLTATRFRLPPILHYFILERVVNLVGLNSLLQAGHLPCSLLSQFSLPDQILLYHQIVLLRLFKLDSDADANCLRFLLLLTKFIPDITRLRF